MFCFENFTSIDIPLLAIIPLYHTIQLSPFICLPSFSMNFSRMPIPFLFLVSRSSHLIISHFFCHSFHFLLFKYISLLSFFYLFISLVFLIHICSIFTYLVSPFILFFKALLFRLLSLSKLPLFIFFILLFPHVSLSHRILLFFLFFSPPSFLHFRLLSSCFDLT